MTSQDLLIARIKQLPEEEVASLRDATSVMLRKHSMELKAYSPCCGIQHIICDGHVLLISGFVGLSRMIFQ